MKTAPNPMHTASLGSSLGEILHLARASSRVLVLLDFDGTLSPIQDEPDAAIVPQHARNRLRRLAEDPRVTVGIVSGRCVNDLEERVGLEGIVYAGNHGIEIHGCGLHFVEPFAFLLEPVLKKLLAELTVRAGAIPNLRIEDKRFTASMNLRGVRPESRMRASEILLSLADESSQFLCRPAKDAFDIVPRNGWHKGRAVRWIRHELGLDEAFVIFAGDDVSDEDAFASLTGAITIKVGDLPTAASHFAHSPSEIWELLAQLETALVSAPG